MCTSTVFFLTSICAELFFVQNVKDFRIRLELFPCYSNPLRLFDLHGHSAFSFHLIPFHSGYSDYIKCVCVQAFEHLLQLELVRPVDAGVCKVQREYQLMRLMLEHSQVMEALQRYPQCPTDVKQWALSAFG